MWISQLNEIKMLKWCRTDWKISLTPKFLKLVDKTPKSGPLPTIQNYKMTANNDIKINNNNVVIVVLIIEIIVVIIIKITGCMSMNSDSSGSRSTSISCWSSKGNIYVYQGKSAL